MVAAGLFGLLDDSGGNTTVSDHNASTSYGCSFGLLSGSVDNFFYRRYDTLS